jgi:uncharacterized surface protein with fasciclin (FAS1) repeats/nucleoid-associated protein YgaU
MVQTWFRRVLAACVVVTLLLTSTTTQAGATAEQAPSAQERMRAQQVSGVLPGGQFAKIWLGVEPSDANAMITLTSEWDRQNAASQGVGFFVLTEQNLADVLNGGANIRTANLAAGGPLSPETPSNVLGAQFQATGSYYTAVLFNDSPTDANFTLTAENAFILDDSNQVRDLQAAPTAVVTGTVTAEGAPAVDGTPAPAATTPAATTAVTTPVAAATPAPTATVPAPAAVTPGQPQVVRSTDLSGELPNQNDQHFLGLEPSERDGAITLLLTFDPQDSDELARRLNFWVLDRDGFQRFQDPNADVVLSNIAIAAGSSDPQFAPNQRRASFTSSGFGPYTVVVYNNSRVPGTYTMHVDGGILTDDAGQTLNARQPVTGTNPVTATVAGPAAATGSSTQPAANTGPAGEPGGTYTVQAGDTLSIIARSIYGDLSLWDELCSANNLANCDVIEVGQVINLPTRDAIGAVVAAAPAATTPAAAATTPAAATTAPTSTLAAATPTATRAATTTLEDSTAMTDTEPVTGTTPSTSTATTGAGGADDADTPAATVDIVASLRANGGFDTLLDALTAANLTDALEGAGPFTIFAPTDTAFAALPAGAMDQLLANPTGQLTQILLFHVLSGKVMSEDITNGMEATTQQGKAVNFEVTGDDVKVNGANVVAKDIEGTNGVVHAIDAVILPPPD